MSTVMTGVRASDWRVGSFLMGSWLTGYRWRASGMYGGGIERIEGRSWSRDRAHRDMLAAVDRLSRELARRSRE